LHSVAVSPDGKILATVSEQGTIKLRRAATDKEALRFKTEMDVGDPESPAAWNQAGDRLWAAEEFVEAEGAYRNAAARLEKLAAHFSNRAEYRAELCRSQLAVSLLLHQTGRQKQAEEALEQCIAIWRTLSGDPSDAAAYATELSHNMANGIELMAK